MRFVVTFFPVVAVPIALTGCRAEAGVDDLVRDVPVGNQTTLGGWVTSQDARCAASGTKAASQDEAVLPVGHVVFRLPDGHDYRVEARTGATREDLTAELDRLSPGADGFVNVSADGAWLLVQTSRFGCGEEMCIAVVDRAACKAQAVVDGHVALHPAATSAIGAKGEVVVFPAEGDHATDLFAIHRTGSDWSAPVNLTKSSPAAYNKQPTLSADGTHVLFDCGPDPGAGAGTAICEAATDGSSLRVAVEPDARGGMSANHHAAYAPDGSIVFEATWNGGAEQVWRVAPGGEPELVNTQKNDEQGFVYTDDNSPCVLPDGRIVSLWLGRAGTGGTGKASGHELKIMGASGEDAAMLVTGVDVVDIGIGCGQ
jgi:hypothetical protein